MVPKRRSLAIRANSRLGEADGLRYELDRYLVDASGERREPRAQKRLSASGVAVVFAFVFWRYYKKHEEALLAKAEREMVRLG